MNKLIKSRHSISIRKLSIRKRGFVPSANIGTGSLFGVLTAAFKIFAINASATGFKL
jgi:hypothetical protein